MFRNIFLWLCLTTLPIAARAQPWAARLDDIAQAELRRQKLPGLVLVVVTGQSIAYAKGFGLANIETKEAVTVGHLFRVGSTTKMITAAALAAAMPEFLNIEGLVSSYLPVTGVYSQYTTTLVVREENGKLMLDGEELAPDRGNCFRRRSGTACFLLRGEPRARYLYLGSRAFARRD